MDRKAWIVLAICSVLLAVNLYVSNQNARLVREQQAAERAKKQAEEEAAKPKDGETPRPDPADPENPDAPAPGPELPAAEEIITLETSDAVFAFTTFGGGIKYAEMTDQSAVGEEHKNVRLNRYGTHPVGRLTTGVDQYLDIVYTHMAGQKTDRSVTFLGNTKDELYVKKTWTLLAEDEPASRYRLTLDLEIQNLGEKPVDLKDYGLFAGAATPLWKGEWARHVSFFFRKDGDYKMKRVSHFKKGKRDVYRADAGNVGFAGVSNQFFVTIVTPAEEYDAWVWADREAVRLPEAAGGEDAESVRLGMSLPEETVAAGGGTKTMSFEVFMGPKRNLMLRKLGEGRGDVMNYTKWFGIGFISRGLNWTLNVLHTKIFAPVSDRWSWGFAIVALTIVIRGLMWPLQQKSTRAMKRMSKLQPQMVELREKFKDEPQKMNQEMMKMYREYGINPLGGCLPLLVQIPIFFGFYTMLMYAVELRQQGFLWVTDLAQPDTVGHVAGLPINLLPIVMAATMVLQMALMPKTGDKMQRRIFMLMPLIFFFFCYNFASALALYWTTSNIFAIFQTLVTQRLPEPELKKRKKGSSFWERMQARAEEAQKMQKARRAQQMGVPQKKPKKRRPRTGG